MCRVAPWLMATSDIDLRLWASYLCSLFLTESPWFQAGGWMSEGERERKSERACLRLLLARLLKHRASMPPAAKT